ncbi:MAG TPA: CBS domain-containing protein [Vicinamibacteria bacterium]|nr:CBS domain-containing protein [Vicinamibacteria bacterium]
MKVEKLMKSDVGVCHPGDPGAIAAKIMWERDCGAVPVVDDRLQVVGMITDRDLCIASYLQGKPLYEISVAGVMSQQLWTCRPDDDISGAEKVMREHQVRRLPVTDEEGLLKGILSLNDIALEAANEAKTKTRKTEVSFTSVAQTLVDISVPHSRRAGASPTQPRRRKAAKKRSQLSSAPPSSPTDRRGPEKGL